MLFLIWSNIEKSFVSINDKDEAIYEDYCSFAALIDLYGWIKMTLFFSVIQGIELVLKSAIMAELDRI